MIGPGFSQPIDHVLEEFVVPALVGTNCNAVRIFLDGGANDIVDASVVTEMNNFGTACLDQAPHNIDGRVVTIEQGRGGDEAQWRLSPLPGRLWQIAGYTTHYRNSLEISYFAGCNYFNPD